MTGASNATETAAPAFDPRQLVKLVVYSLLLVNFVLYFLEDLSISQHRLRNGGSVFDYSSAFAVTLDVLAWLTLLFLFELETYLLSDEAFTRFRLAVMHGVRLLCYLFLGHTLVACAAAGVDLVGLSPMPGISSLCQLAGETLSFGFNITYAEIRSSA